ncbi:hypothetical protein C8T65DRAFT_74658 [Cerioporus squamosus]|nr:hypothetical protein C8T65DRAFT_74658 [Cerioporus squamosus]
MRSQQSADGARISSAWLTTFMENEQRESISDSAYVGPWSAFKDAISACPMLETIHIGILPYVIDQFFNGTAPFVPQRYQLFTSIAGHLPPGFRTFVLSLHTRWDSPSWSRCIQLWDLEALDALSDERRFIQFARLVVYMPEWPDIGVVRAMEAAEQGVQERLPRLYSAKKISMGGTGRQRSGSSCSKMWLVWYVTVCWHLFLYDGLETYMTVQKAQFIFAVSSFER